MQTREMHDSGWTHNHPRIECELSVQTHLNTLCQEDRRFVDPLPSVHAKAADRNVCCSSKKGQWAHFSVFPTDRRYYQSLLRRRLDNEPGVVLLGTSRFRYLGLSGGRATSSGQNMVLREILDEDDYGDRVSWLNSELIPFTSGWSIHPKVMDGNGSTQWDIYVPSVR